MSLDRAWLVALFWGREVLSVCWIVAPFAEIGLRVRKDLPVGLDSSEGSNCVEGKRRCGWASRARGLVVSFAHAAAPLATAAVCHETA